MAYEDFLRQYNLGTTSTSIPGLQSPVTLQPVQGSSTPAWVQQAIQQQNTVQNQIVQQQAIRDQQNAAEAERQAKLAEEAAKARHRGGGWLSPITRMVHGLADYPQNVANALTTIRQNPTSLMAWGKGMLAVSSYAAPILNVPLDYNKLLIGEIVQSAAMGQMTPGLSLASYMMGPAARLNLMPVLKALNLAMPDDIKQGIATAYGDGYKQYTGGNGVWEYMQSSLDDLPPVLRYPIRAAIEIVEDPLTWVGVGAARDAAKLAEVERLAGAQTPLGRLGAQAERGLTGTRNRNPLIIADEFARKINRPVDEAFTGLGYGARQAARAIPGRNIFEPSEKRLQERGVRETGWHLGRFSRDQEANASDGLFNLPGFNEVNTQTTAAGQTVHTLQNVADNSQTLVIEEADGNVRVISSRDPNGQLFPDAQTAAQEVYRQAKQVQTVPTNPVQEAPPQPLSTRELQGPPNRFEQSPSPRLEVRDLPNGFVEISLRGRGTRYLTQDVNGLWSVVDEGNREIQSGLTQQLAYEAAKNDLYNTPYAYTTLSGGQDVGPSFGAKPGGMRPQDVVAGMDASDPRVAQFNDRLHQRISPYARIIQEQDEQTRRTLEESGTLRRDLGVDQANAYGRPRTNDSVAKSLAEALGAARGHETYNDIFGRPSQAFPRMWEGDEAKLIRQFNARSREVRNLSAKDTINTREAIRQALFTPSHQDAETIIQWFEHRRYPVDASTARGLLLFTDSPEAQRILKNAERSKSVSLGKLLRENRAILNKERNQIVPEPTLRPRDPGAPTVVPTEVVREPIPYDPTLGPPAPAGTREFETPKGAAQMRKRAIEAFNQGTLRDEMTSVNDRLDELYQERVKLIGSKNLAARRKLDSETTSLKLYREKLEAAAKGHEAESTLGFRPGDFQKNRTIPAHQVGEVDPTLQALPPTTSPQIDVSSVGAPSTPAELMNVPESSPKVPGLIAEPDLPPIPTDHVRLVHLTAPNNVEGIRKNGLDYSRQGMIDSTASAYADAKDVQLWSKDPRYSSPNTVAVVMDVPFDEYRQHRNVTNHPGFIPPEQIVGVVGQNVPPSASSAAPTTFTDVQSATPTPTPAEPGAVAAPVPGGVHEKATPFYQALQDAGDDPVKRQQASDAFVREVTGEGAVKMDEQASGYGSYLIRGEEGMPEVSIHIGDDNSVTVTALDPNDPTARNIIARAGTDVPVTVRQGIPDQVLAPAGLDTPGMMPDSDKIADPLARSLALGKISQEGHDALSETIEVALNPSGKGKKVSMRIGDYYIMQRGVLGDQKAALEATMAAVRKAKVTGGANLPKIIRGWDSFINHQRDVLMFNWATGAPAGVLDHLGDTFRMSSMGRLSESLKVNRLFEKDEAGKRHLLPNVYRQAYRETKGDLTSMMANTDDGRYLSALGIEETPNVALAKGREETHREGKSQIARSLEKRGVDTKVAKGVQRAAATVLMDGSDFMMHMRSAGDLGRRFTTYVGSIRRQMPQARNDFLNLAEDRAAREAGFNMGTFEQSLGDVFSADDVRIRAAEAGAGPGMAERLARDWQESLTKMEKLAAEDLDKVLFSYESTQADEVLKRIFLFHYWFSRATINYTRTIIANPYLYANYTRAMDGLERASDGQPSAVKGLIKTMSGPGGFMILMDPIKFMTTAVSLRDQAYQDGDGNAFDNFMSQSGLFFNPALQAAASFLGLSKNDNPDPLTTFQMRRIFGGAANLINAERGGKMLGSPYQEAMNNAVEKGSEFWSNLGIPFSEVQRAKDPKANDRTLIRNEILDLVEKDLGIEMGTDFGQWSPEQIKTLEDAYEALDTGVSNPYADQAYKNWARTNAIRVGMGMTLPVGTSLRSETRDERLNASRRVTNPETGESFMPTGSLGYDQERDVTSAASGLPTNIAISDAQFDALFPANAAGRMSTGPNGETQSDVRAQPQNAAYDAYRQWKSEVVGGPDNYHAFRLQMERVSPAYRAYMGELKSQAFYQENPDALDNAGASFGAYMVLNGDKIQQFDPNRGPTFDISSVNPSTFGTGAGQTQTYAAPASMEELQQTIIGQLMSYQQDQQAFQQAAQRYFGQPIQIDAISPYAQRYIRNELAKFGVRIPELGTQASAYQAWARTQPMGADTSIQAYLRSFGTQTPLTPFPSQATMMTS